MCDDHRRRIDQLLRILRSDETAFNRIAEAEQLGVFLRHGRLYPAAVGQTHTTRIARELSSGPPNRESGSIRPADELMQLTG